MASEIGPNTKLNVATLVAVVGAAVWIDRRISIAETSTENSQKVLLVQNQAEFDKIDLRLRSIESAAEAISGDRWRRADMRGWTREFKAMNPTLPVPQIE